MTHTALSPKLRPVPAQQRSERKFGEVSEWLKEHAWKVCIRQRIEGSNPSLTAKSKKTDLRVGFLLSGKRKHLCRQVSQSHAVADHPHTHPPVCKALMEHHRFSYCQHPPPTLLLCLPHPTSVPSCHNRSNKMIAMPSYGRNTPSYYGRYPAPINCSAIGFHFEKLILK